MALYQHCPPCTYIPKIVRTKGESKRSFSLRSKVRWHGLHLSSIENRRRRASPELPATIKSKSKDFFLHPYLPLPFLHHSKRPDLPLCVSFLPAEIMQHLQLEEISISEPFDALHPNSPNWVSFSRKAGKECYSICRTYKTQKLEKRQPVVSIISFAFAVCL
jgi:hypothetical protein